MVLDSGNLRCIVELRHIRAAYGAALVVLAPPLLRRLGTGQPDERLLCAARFLGVRQLTEGLLPQRVRPLLLTIDAIHLASMIGFAELDPERRKPAVASLVITGALATTSVLTAGRQREG